MDLEQDVDISTSAEAFEATALCRGHVVHTGKDMCETPEVQPLPPALRRTPAEEKSEAQWAYERLVLFIKNFEERLDQDQEIALGMTGGTSGALRIEGLGYFAPDILTFYGRDEQGARTQLRRARSRDAGGEEEQANVDEAKGHASGHGRRLCFISLSKFSRRRSTRCSARGS